MDKHNRESMTSRCFGLEFDITRL